MAEAELKLSMMSTTGEFRNCSMFRYINSLEFMEEAVVWREIIFLHQGLCFGRWIIEPTETLIKNHNNGKIETISDNPSNKVDEFAVQDWEVK